MAHRSSETRNPVVGGLSGVRVRVRGCLGVARVGLLMPSVSFG